MNFKLSFSSIDKDLPAGLVVFLVALPLCLGVALASGAPLFAGIIAGVVGGIIVGFFSGSSIGVSGPAAGLTVIVASAIQELGQFETFLAAVVLAGVLQIVLSFLGAGKIAFFFPSSVIKGMLSAIGLIIILKQLPHAFGIDRDEEGDFSFLQHDGENTFSELLKIGQYFNEGALIIGSLSILLIIFWDKFFKKNPILSKIPSALIVVVLGIVINSFFPETLVLGEEHLVKLPVANNASEFASFLKFPNFTSLSNFLVIKTAVVLAIIASLETLLCVEATDKLNPEPGITPTKQELLAQGIGNIVSGMIGGLPLTQVIVRSSANIQAGGKTKLSAMIHGMILLLSVVFIPTLLNKIPLASLAAILIMVGYKLASLDVFKRTFKDGYLQFIPFIVTVIAILFSDLLTGIVIGLVVGIAFVLFTNFKSAVAVQSIDNTKMIKLNKDIFFFNKAELMGRLMEIEKGDSVIIDGSKANFIDFDIYTTLQEFIKESNLNGSNIEQKGISIEKTK